MEELTLKVKIAVLWIFLAVGMSAAMLLLLMAPGTIEEVIAGEMGGMEISEGVLFMFSLFWLVPLAMAFFSVTLKRAANRVLNIALGLFFAVFYIVDTSGHLIRGELFFTHLVICIIAVIVGILIFLYALRWPKVTTGK
jgi:hypothetical protein